MRRSREEKERKNSRLSSWKQKISGRKKVSRKWKIAEVKTEDKHLWNGCGSEAGKSEKKRTAKLSTGIWKEGMRNQVGEKEERKKQRLSSQNRKRSGRKEAD